MGMPPPQLASHLSCTPFSRALAASASTWRPSRALLAVTMCLPLAKAVSKISVAGCSPPISSTTMSTSGSVATSCQSVVKASRVMPAASACSHCRAQARLICRSMPKEARYSS